MCQNLTTWITRTVNNARAKLYDGKIILSQYDILNALNIHAQYKTVAI